MGAMAGGSGGDGRGVAIVEPDRARDAGAMAYLVKPFTIPDLVPAIEMATSRFAEISALEREVARLRR